MSMQIRYNTTDGSRKPETKYKCWPPSPGDEEMRAAERKFASNKNCLHLILKFELFIFYTIYGHLKSTTNNKYQILDYKMLANENL